MDTNNHRQGRCGVVARVARVAERNNVHLWGLGTQHLKVNVELQFKNRYCILPLCSWVCPSCTIVSHANHWLHIAQRVAATVSKQSEAFSCFYLGSLLRPLPQASLLPFMLPPSNQVSHLNAIHLKYWHGGVDRASYSMPALNPRLHNNTREGYI